MIVLLLLNAVVVSNATKDAYVRDDGARLVDTSHGALPLHSLTAGTRKVKVP